MAVREIIRQKELRQKQLRAQGKELHGEEKHAVNVQRVRGRPSIRALLLWYALEKHTPYVEVERVTSRRPASAEVARLLALEGVAVEESALAAWLEGERPHG